MLNVNLKCDFTDSQSFESPKNNKVEHKKHTLEVSTRGSSNFFSFIHDIKIFIAINSSNLSVKAGSIQAKFSFPFFKSESENI